MSNLCRHLISAIAFGDNSLCLDLLRQGIDVNAIDKNDWTALHWSAGSGQVDTAQMLFDFGARVQVANKTGASPLHFAATHGHTDTCVLFLEHGSDPSSKNHAGDTAWDIAMRRGHEDCANAMRAWASARVAREVLREIVADSALKMRSS